MDWRQRDYYLIKTDYMSYEMRHRFYKLAAPSVKYHIPYNHFPNGNKKMNYDGDFHTVCGMASPQEMISCKKEESENLEYELRKAFRNDGCGSRFVKLDKTMTRQ